MVGRKLFLISHLTFLSRKQVKKLMYPLMTITRIRTTPVLETEVMMFKTIRMLKNIIGIILFFRALTFAGSRRNCLKPRSLGQEFKHLPRDPAKVYAMKQTCMIVILASLLFPI